MKNRNVIIMILILLILILVSISIYMAFNYREDEDVVTPPLDEEEEEPNYSFDTNNIENCDVCTIDNNGNRINNSSKLKEQHDTEDFIVNDMEITSYKENFDVAIVKFEVKNISDSNYENLDLMFTFLDKEGNSKNQIIFPVGKISTGETVIVEDEILYQIINSYDFTFEECTVEGY